MAAFTQRQATPKKDYGHRGSTRKFESSDDDSSDQSDSDEEQSWKRRKTTSAPSVSHRMTFPESTTQRGQQGRGGRFERPDHRPPRSNDGGGGGAGKRRKNNIWGSVAVEQNQETVEREITHFGVDQVMERDVESYSYKDTEQLPLGVATNILPGDDVVKGRRLMKAVGENEDDAWLADNSPGQSDEEEERKQPHDDLREKLKKRGSMVADKFRRSNQSNVKSRLGLQSDNTEQVTVMKQVEIDPKSEAKVIAGQIAYSLQEPKGHLVLRIVKILGVEKSLEIWRKTEEIENDGGMMIRNRSRRRSPGGVFIQLMKTDPDISAETVKEIFAEEKKAFEAEKKKKRRLTRKSAGFSKEEEEEDGCHGNKIDEAEMEAMEDGGGKSFKGDGEPRDKMDMRDAHNDESYINDRGLMPSASGEPPNVHSFEDKLPLPQKECTDINEDNDNMMFPKFEDIPKRNEDSDPEDGEVLDDDDDDD